MQEHVITPRRGWFDIDIKGLWYYRDLYMMYIRRDIVIQYKQTILGPIWYIIQPLLTTLIYMFVFGGLAGISTDGIPQPLFYLSGILLWNYFSDSFLSCSEVFAENVSVFGKIYFPRLIIPLSSITSNLLKLGIQFALFFIVYNYYLFNGLSGELSISCLAFFFLPFLILLTGLLALACGLIFSSLTTKYRDLKFLLSFGVQLLMFATPVIYPLNAAPEKYADIIRLNPLTPIFETFKSLILGTGLIDWTGIIYSSLFVLIFLVLGIIFFSRTERDFMDTI